MFELRSRKMKYRCTMVTNLPLSIHRQKKNCPSYFSTLYCRFCDARAGRRSTSFNVVQRRSTSFNVVQRRSTSFDRRSINLRLKKIGRQLINSLSLTLECFWRNNFQPQHEAKKMLALVRVLVIDQAWARAQRPRPDFSPTVKKVIRWRLNKP